MKHIVKDLIGFWLLASVSLAAALFMNQLRDHPLSLVYASKKQRIEQSVAQVAETTEPIPAADNKPHVIDLARKSQKLSTFMSKTQSFASRRTE